MNYYNPTPEQMLKFSDWLEANPDHPLCEIQFDPWHVYLKAGKPFRIVTIYNNGDIFIRHIRQLVLDYDPAYCFDADDDSNVIPKDLVLAFFSTVTDAEYIYEAV